MFKTKLDVRSLFDAHFSTDTTKILSLLARYLSFSTPKCHKNLTQHDREIDNQTDGATRKRAIWNVLELLNCNVNILKMANMELIDVSIKRHTWLMWPWIGQTLQKDESSVARQAMQWNPLDGIGWRNGRSCETCRRTVQRECKNLNKTWSDLKQLSQSRVRCRVGVVDALCPGRDQGSRKLRRKRISVNIKWSIEDWDKNSVAPQHWLYKYTELYF